MLDWGPVLYGAFLVLCIVLLLVVIQVFLVVGSWRFHFEAVNNNSEKSGRGTFEIFIREFESREWKVKNRYSNSFFGEDYPLSQVHASIFMFDGVGMTFGFFDYLRVERFLKERWKEETKDGPVQIRNYEW